MAKIVIVLGRLVIGGSTIDTINAAAYLQKDNEIIIVTGGSEKNEFEAAYLTSHLHRAKLVRISGFLSRFSLLSDFKTYRKLCSTLKKLQPDVVHTHSAKAGLIGRLAARRAKVPVIIHTYHGLVFEGYFSRFISQCVIQTERWLAQFTTTIIALSQNQQEQITNKFKICPAEKVTIIPLGIEISKYNHNKEKLRADFRATYFLENNEVAIGLIGRIVPIKNHDFFLKAIKELSQQGMNARFFIIGDGTLRQTLQHKAGLANISYVYFPETPQRATLTFTSWITEIEWVMAGLDMVVLTSHSEGTPVSLIEAQAAGKPVVSVNTGGIADIVQNGETGFITSPGDSRAFCDKLIQLIENPALRTQMGEAGIQFVSDRFKKDRQVTALNTLYNKYKY